MYACGCVCFVVLTQPPASRVPMSLSSLARNDSCVCGSSTRLASLSVRHLKFSLSFWEALLATDCFASLLAAPPPPPEAVAPPTFRLVPCPAAMLDPSKKGSNK